MKTLTTLILFIGIIATSCLGQQKIANIKNENVAEAKSSKYKIRKDNVFATIENTDNKLTNINQLSPNLPKNLNLSNITSYDRNLVKQICSNILSQSQINEALTKRKNASLFVRVKSDLTGIPIELEFLTDQNSNININQIQDIESAIRRSVRIKIDQQLERYLKGSNFIITDITIWLRELLN